MMPLKYIREKHKSNIAFVCQNLSALTTAVTSPNHETVQYNSSLHLQNHHDRLKDMDGAGGSVTLNDAFSIAWFILGIYQKIGVKVKK